MCRRSGPLTRRGGRGSAPARPPRRPRRSPAAPGAAPPGASRASWRRRRRTGPRRRRAGRRAMRASLRARRASAAGSSRPPGSAGRAGRCRGPAGGSSGSGPRAAGGPPATEQAAALGARTAGRRWRCGVPSGSSYESSCAARRCVCGSSRANGSQASTASPLTVMLSERARRYASPARNRWKTIARCSAHVAPSRSRARGRSCRRVGRRGARGRALPQHDGSVLARGHRLEQMRAARAAWSRSRSHESRAGPRRDPSAGSRSALAAPGRRRDREPAALDSDAVLRPRPKWPSARRS